MPDRLFVFIQVELPFSLGVPDGRYLLRERSGGEPEHVFIVGSPNVAPPPRRRWWQRLRGRGSGRAWRGQRVESPPAPPSTHSTRATVIDPVSLSAERQAQAWLDALDAEAQIVAAFGVVNRALFAHRIAGADPGVHALAPAQATAMRAGWGLGGEVADGHWSHARELHWAERQPRRRVAALRPQERFAALLGGRAQPLICEELALRARADLDAGRTRHAALELDRAYAAALAELPAIPHAGLTQRLAELEELRPAVADAAAAALPASGEADGAPLSADAVGHALARLEATLRARALEPQRTSGP